MRVGAQDYIFRKNIQGDVTHIYTKEGNLVVHYSYDAWGNCKVYTADGTLDTNLGSIGNANPFRYRGYYYDSETALYYLNTRYYDPETARFINADDISYLDPETINGLNLYAYCGDNPVMRTDANGNAWWEFWKWDWAKISMVLISTVEVSVGIALIITGVGGPLGMALIGMGASSLISGVIAESNGGSFLGGWAGGQISGIITAFVPYVGAPLGSFIGSIVTDWIDNGWNKINWQKAGLSAAVSFAFDILPQNILISAGESLYKSINLQLLLSYRGGLVGVINSIFNTYYNKIEQRR